MVTTTPRWSEQVRQQYGVCTHPNFQTETYGHVDSWTWRLHQLGAPTFRGLYAHQLPNVARTVTRARDLGLRWLATVYPPDWSMSLDDLRARLDHLAQNAADVIVGIEGVNEPNHNRGGGAPPDDWAQRAANVQAVIDEKVTEHPSLSHVVKVGPALHTTVATAEQDVHTLAATGIADHMVAYSLHHYPAGRCPIFRLGVKLAWIADAFGDLFPVWVSETGYQNALNDDRTRRNPVSERAADQYAVRNVLDYLAHPRVDRVFRYEALDDPDPGRANAEANFGIFRTPAEDPAAWRGKPEYITMAGFCDTLADSAASHSPAPIRITVTPPAGEKVNWLITEHSSGRRHIWLRRPRAECWDISTRTDVTVPPVPVRVHRPNWTRTINVAARAVGFPIP